MENPNNANYSITTSENNDLIIEINNCVKLQNENNEIVTFYPIYNGEIAFILNSDDQIIIIPPPKDFAYVERKFEIVGFHFPIIAYSNNIDETERLFLNFFQELFSKNQRVKEVYNDIRKNDFREHDDALKQQGLLNSKTISKKNFLHHIKNKNFKANINFDVIEIKKVKKPVISKFRVVIKSNEIVKSITLPAIIDYVKMKKQELDKLLDNTNNSTETNIELPPPKKIHQRTLDKNERYIEITSYYLIRRKSENIKDSIKATLSNFKKIDLKERTLKRAIKDNMEMLNKTEYKDDFIRSRKPPK